MPFAQGRTRIKICGITRSEDMAAAVGAGADAVGLVFYEKSPRFVPPETAAALVREVPPYVSVVGLFVDAEADYVAAVLKAVPLSELQFHGDEPPEVCRRYRLPYTRAIRMTADADLLQYAGIFSDARGLLLDAFVPGVPGGTGQRFDWQRVPKNFPKPLVVSGGLDPECVGEAVRVLRPWAVDVSSGVEAAKGIKDAAKIAAFMQGVRDADRELAR